MQAQMATDASYLGWGGGGNVQWSHSFWGLKQTYIIPVFRRKGDACHFYGTKSLRNPFTGETCADSNRQYLGNGIYQSHGRSQSNYIRTNLGNLGRSLQEWHLARVRLYSRMCDLSRFRVMQPRQTPLAPPSS